MIFLRFWVSSCMNNNAFVCNSWQVWELLLCMQQKVYNQTFGQQKRNEKVHRCFWVISLQKWFKAGFLWFFLGHTKWWHGKRMITNYWDYYVLLKNYYASWSRQKMDEKGVGRMLLFCAFMWSPKKIKSVHLPKTGKNLTRTREEKNINSSVCLCVSIQVFHADKKWHEWLIKIGRNEQFCPAPYAFSLLIHASG